MKLPQNMNDSFVDNKNQGSVVMPKSDETNGQKQGNGKNNSFKNAANPKNI